MKIKSQVIKKKYKGEGGNGELLFNGYKVSVFQDEKVLEASCTIM